MKQKPTYQKQRISGRQQELAPQESQFEVCQRLRQLSPLIIELLSLTAIIGRTFEGVLLEDVPATRVCLSGAEDLARKLGFKKELAFILLAQASLEWPEYRQEDTTSTSIFLADVVSLFKHINEQTANPYPNERLHPSTERGSPLSLPAGLSPREAEVIRLVAQGKSNRAIAEALVISERTVANHLASIFNKTGVENRAAAAAFAIRHNLVQ